MNYYDEALKLHEKYQGKIHMEVNCDIQTMDDMSVVYTPGVAQPCREIAENEAEVYRYTTKANTIAVVSNGTAVLGLGNIGAKASIPVMEGKAALFKKFGDVNAVPICLDSQDKEELITTIKNLAPCFGGINLEDIASPDCFEIEERLDAMLDIPVFHDDQHGTAVVVLAALYNALRVIKKDIAKITVVLNGPGAAGTAIIKMLHTAGVGKIIAVDEFGILHKDRTKGLIPHKRAICDITNPDGIQGTLADALKGADVFIGVSKPNLVSEDMVRSMNSDPVIFAMANPEPEITYEKAKAAGARVVGTGRSDFPNQINNVLAFPGVFKGALAARVPSITPEMKVAAAKAIAYTISDEELSEDNIMPQIFNKKVTAAVAQAIIDCK
ncbi:NADP-dependent malic enzyme [[Clostridium] spiroforme]|nr:NADP-dependent malic enzyme [Thomasclavelia spiroformis]MBM6880650.1 NADP-dependent malic enzyme [Thomasclavelia spiroformis]